MNFLILVSLVMFEAFVGWIRQYAQRPQAAIPLHETYVADHEYNIIKDCLDSRTVSSVGSYVEVLEQRICRLTGARYATAVVNGTSGLHIALLITGVQAGDLVITSPFSYVATGNAIRYTGAEPVFLDIDRHTLGLSPQHLADFLEKQAVRKPDGSYHRGSGRRIAACLPVHAFGHPAAIDEIVAICTHYGIPVIEDAAESLGSYYKERHTGTWGSAGVFSFNGNKIVTCGGGGMVVTHDRKLAAKARHLTTQAKVREKYSYYHDQVGYNYRMPNLNAALGCAQMESIEYRLEQRKALAAAYRRFFATYDVTFFQAPLQAASNYWMQAVILESEKQRDDFVQFTNERGIHTRPAWRLLHRFPMFSTYEAGSLTEAVFIEKQVACLPSSIYR